jgi:hypothetical protein
MIEGARRIVRTASRSGAGHVKEYVGTGFQQQKSPGTDAISRPPGFHASCAATYLRASRRTSGHQRCCWSEFAPSGGITSTATPMARRYARWRIHCEPPSWLRPRRKMARPLPPKLNVGHWKIPVKSSDNFLQVLGSPAASGIPHRSTPAPLSLQPTLEWSAPLSATWFGRARDTATVKCPTG